MASTVPLSGSSSKRHNPGERWNYNISDKVPISEMPLYYFILKDMYLSYILGETYQEA